MIAAAAAQIGDQAPQVTATALEARQVELPAG